jgi:hypothetical protein
MRILVWIGSLLCMGLPTVVLVGFGAAALMPGCNVGGSGGPASGCYLFGAVNLNWLVDLGLVAFVGSFITVPVGLVILGLSVFWSPSKPDPYKGIFNKD